MSSDRLRNQVQQLVIALAPLLTSQVMSMKTVLMVRGPRGPHGPLLRRSSFLSKLLSVPLDLGEQMESFVLHLLHDCFQSCLDIDHPCRG